MIKDIPKTSFEWLIPMVGWSLKFDHTLQGNKHVPPLKRRIIDSKVPAGRGYVSSQEDRHWKMMLENLMTTFISFLKGICWKRRSEGGCCGFLNRHQYRWFCRQFLFGDASATPKTPAVHCRYIASWPRQNEQRHPKMAFVNLPPL